MKLIIAIIQPFKLDQVRDALVSVGFEGLTVTNVQGSSRGLSHVEVFRGSEFRSDFLPKTKIEIVVDDDRVARVVDVIVASAQTSGSGDGKILVLPLDLIVPIRTKARTASPTVMAAMSMS